MKDVGLIWIRDATMMDRFENQKWFFFRSFFILFRLAIKMIFLVIFNPLSTGKSKWFFDHFLSLSRLKIKMVFLIIFILNLEIEWFF